MHKHEQYHKNFWQDNRLKNYDIIRLTKTEQWELGQYWTNWTVGMWTVGMWTVGILLDVGMILDSWNDVDGLNIMNGAQNMKYK